MPDCGIPGSTTSTEAASVLSELSSRAFLSAKAVNAADWPWAISQNSSLNTLMAVTKAAFGPRSSAPRGARIKRIAQELFPPLRASKSFLPASSAAPVLSKQRSSSLRFRSSGRAIQSASGKVSGPDPRSTMLSPSLRASGRAGSSLHSRYTFHGRK